MASYNRVILMGNLTRDPDLTYLPSNTAACKFGLATNRKWKDQSGNQKEEVTFVDCSAFGRTAEVINQYMSKGKALLVEGRLHFSQWTDRDGKNRSKLDVVVESCQFVGGQGQGQGNGQQHGGQPPRDLAGQQDGGQQAPPPRQFSEEDQPPDRGSDIAF